MTKKEVWWVGNMIPVVMMLGGGLLGDVLDVWVHDYAFWYCLALVIGSFYLQFKLIAKFDP